MSVQHNEVFNRFQKELKMKIQFTLFFTIAFLLLSCVNKSTSVVMSNQQDGSKQVIITDKGERTVLSVGSDMNKRGIDFSKTPTKIAFGSCADQDKPQPLWTLIEKQKPDLFLFMGDNVYAKLPEQKPISEQYKKLNQIPEFISFIQKTPIMAIWDNNDYGSQDLGADYPDKENSRKDFLIQWPYVKDSLEIGQQGIYHAKIIGGESVGKKKKKRLVGPQVQVIMLDTRWGRSPIRYNPDTTDYMKPYLPWDENDTEHQFLSTAQWEWFEEQLNKKADFRIVVSSVQLIANEHSFQKWGNFPKERQRFFDLLKKTKVKNLIVLSGDRHIGTMAKMEIKGWGTLYDITASSINKSKNFTETDPSYLFPVISSENYGTISFDWSKKTALIELRDKDDNVKADLKLPIH